MNLRDLWEKRTRSSLGGMILARWKHLLPGRPPLYTETIPGKVAGRSIFIRHLDCGSSNAVEQEIMALFNPLYDLERFGFQLVASPRHADLLLVTGPFTHSMVTAAVATFHAMPEPRAIITVGDDFHDTGPFRDSYALAPLPAELTQARIGHIPGDPPTPEAIIEALLNLTEDG